MTQRTTRTLRGIAFAVLSTLLAAVAHTLGGGGAPSPLFCAAVAALALPFAVLLSGPRVRAWRTWAAVVGSQFVFHAVFAATGDLGAWNATTGHVHGTIALEPAASGAATLSADMLFAHAVAAVIAALLVRRGERAVLAVLRGLRRFLARAVVALPPVIAPLPVLTVVRSAPRPRLSTTPLSRRGPPALLAAV